MYTCGKNTRNLTVVAKNATLYLHGEIQLELFDDEAAPKPILLEKHNSCAEMVF